MMDLEIADYERTVKSLHEAVAERDAKIQSLHEEIQCKEQQCVSLQKLHGIFLLVFDIHLFQVALLQYPIYRTVAEVHVPKK